MPRSKKSNFAQKDLDADGFGSDFSTESLPEGVDVGTDCNDSNLNVNTDAEEICDDIDNCDNQTDESLGIEEQCPASSCKRTWN